jgi:GGDEF domain-containing protein
MTKPMPDADDDLTSALLQVPDLLLDALSLHAAKLDASECESFQAVLGKLQSDLKQADLGSRVLETTGEIIDAIASYNRYLERQVGLQMQDERLGTEEAPGATPLQACEEPQRGPKTPPVAGSEDPVTGLPGQSLAEIAFQQAIESSAHAHAVAFCVNRMATIKERFGSDHGDQIMMLYSQHLAQQLSAGDQLFRWRGPCLVGLISRPDDATSGAWIRRLGATRFDHSLESNHRVVLVPVSASWTAIRLWEQESVAHVREALDTFLRSNSRHSTR